MNALHWLTLGAAICALVSIWIDRAEHDRELLDKRLRHYQGGDLK